MNSSQAPNPSAPIMNTLRYTWCVVFSALLLAGLIYWLLLPVGATIAGSLSVVTFAAILWISEVLPLPVTALLIPIGLVVTRTSTLDTAFISFAHPIVFLVLGGYALAVAVSTNQIDRWLAVRILDVAGNGAFRVLIALMGTSALLSMFISNTAATALLLPMAINILHQCPEDANLNRLLLLGVAYGASIGGVATLVGSTPNAIVAGLLDIGFLEWLSYGLPVSLLMLAAAALLLWWTFPVQQRQIEASQGIHTPMTPAGKQTLVVIGITVFLWLFGPSLAALLSLPADVFNATIVAVVSVPLLLLLGCVDWKALEKGIQWGVLILLGGGLTLGHALTESGAADWLGGLLVNSVGELPPFALLLMLVAIAVFVTELVSNTAMAANMSPIVLGAALQLGMEASTLVIPIAIATSMAFMLPVATPPNALVHATGIITQRNMLRAGFPLNLAAIIIITCLFHFGILGK